MESIFQQLSELVLHVVVAVVAPALAAILVQGLRLVSVQLSAAQEAKVRDIVTQAILETEEWAAGRLKGQLPVTSGQKLMRALSAVTAKVPGISEQEAEDLIRQELPKVGLGAVHFLRQAAHAATTP